MALLPLASPRGLWQQTCSCAGRPHRVKLSSPQYRHRHRSSVVTTSVANAPGAASTKPIEDVEGKAVAPTLREDARARPVNEPIHSHKAAKRKTSIDDADLEVRLFCDKHRFKRCMGHHQCSARQGPAAPRVAARLTHYQASVNELRWLAIG